MKPVYLEENPAELIEKSGWYFFDEAALPCGPYKTSEEAERAEIEYIKTL